MQITSYRDGHRSYYVSDTPMRVRVRTPSLLTDQTGIRQLVHDTRDATSIASGLIADTILAINGVVPQEIDGHFVHRMRHVAAEAHCFLGVMSDIPTVNSIERARYISHSGAHQMTVMLFLTRPVTTQQCRMLLCALNWAVSDSLGVEYCEWFAAPDDDTFGSSSGLVIAAPETGEYPPSEEVQHACVHATRGALAVALTRYFTRIS